MCFLFIFFFVAAFLLFHSLPSFLLVFLSRFLLPPYLFVITLLSLSPGQSSVCVSLLESRQASENSCPSNVVSRQLRRNMLSQACFLYNVLPFSPGGGMSLHFLRTSTSLRPTFLFFLGHRLLPLLILPQTLSSSSFCFFILCTARLSCDHEWVRSKVYARQSINQIKIIVHPTSQGQQQRTYRGRWSTP